MSSIQEFARLVMMLIIGPLLEPGSDEPAKEWF